MKRSQLQQKFTHLIRFSVCLNLTSVVPLAVKPIAVGHNQSLFNCSKVNHFKALLASIKQILMLALVRLNSW